MYCSDKIIILMSSDNDPDDDSDGGNCGNKNSTNNGFSGSVSGKNSKSSLRDGLVECRGIEPLTSTLPALRSPS